MSDVNLTRRGVKILFFFTTSLIWHRAWGRCERRRVSSPQASQAPIGSAVRWLAIAPLFPRRARPHPHPHLTEQAHTLAGDS